MRPSRPIQRYARNARRGDEALAPEVERVWSENFEVYGVRKVWRQLRREQFTVARCTVQRLMNRLGLKGVVRGKAVRTTVSDPKAACPLDHVQRRFQADRPNALWVQRLHLRLDLARLCLRGLRHRCIRTPKSSAGRHRLRLGRTRVARRARAGAVCTPPRRPRRPQSAHSSLGQGRPVRFDALHRAACPGWPGAFSRQRGRLLRQRFGRDDQRLVQKAEVIHRRPSWRTRDEVEWATLNWVDWFNNRRLLEPIGNIPPAEAEANYYLQVPESAISA